MVSREQQEREGREEDGGGERKRNQLHTTSPLLTVAARPPLPPRSGSLPPLSAVQRHPHAIGSLLCGPHAQALLQCEHLHDDKQTQHRGEWRTAGGGGRVERSGWTDRLIHWPPTHSSRLCVFLCPCCCQVLVNLSFLLLCVLGRSLKRAFLGALQRDEIEELVQSSKYAITETMLALTIFREELNLKLLMLFTALLFIKIFHWLASMRVESLARAENIGRLQHVRLVALLAFLAAVDWSFVAAIGITIMHSRTASVLLLFGFEVSESENKHSRAIWVFFVSLSLLPHPSLYCLL